MQTQTIKANELKVGDVIQSFTGKPKAVKTIHRIGSQIAVNATVKGESQTLMYKPEHALTVERKA